MTTKVPSQPAIARLHQYLVRRTWIECAAVDAGLELKEFEVDLLLELAGPPLLPSQSFEAAPPWPAAGMSWSTARDQIHNLADWASRSYHQMGSEPPGLRQDVQHVWPRRALWAWEHLARNQTWADIAERQAKRHPDDADRWRYVKREAERAVSAGCGDVDPPMLMNGIRKMMAAYASITAQADGPVVH